MSCAPGDPFPLGDDLKMDEACSRGRHKPTGAAPSKMPLPITALGRGRLWYGPSANYRVEVTFSSGLGCIALTLRARQEAEHMFYHGYDNYMKHAFPEDELRPISCTPLTRDRSNPAHIELNDALGNYSLTLIDSLSTLAVMASSSSTNRGQNKALEYFQAGVAALVEQYGDGTIGRAGTGKRAIGFDLDSKVQVFETTIRGVGGLLSAHLFAIGELPIRGYDPREPIDMSGTSLSIRWPNQFVYDGQLLRLAHDLGRRLLPAFTTATGIPYPRVNLRHGVPFYPNSPLNNNAESGQCQATQNTPVELTETCSAGAGSLVLEFVTLSRLTGDPVFEQVAKRAFWAIWERKSSIGLVGSGIDSESGQWTTPFTGIGAGIDSFYEYAAKASVLLSGSDIPAESSLTQMDDLSRLLVTHSVPNDTQTAEAFGQAWQESHASIKHHLYRGGQYTHPHYVQNDLYTGASRAFWIDSLSAFYSGLLVMNGNLEEAIETHLLHTALWTRYSALPERWSTSSGAIEAGLGWWGGRPEFIESTYHLFHATKDPWYLHVGEMVLRDIKRRCWTKCGWAGIQDVRSGAQSDRMESFFLGETTKYLFLMFDPDHPLNKLDASFVFSTEGHPLIIPRVKAAARAPRRGQDRMLRQRKDHRTCPLPPAMLPFSISPTAARNDIFHAAKLARLNLMPTSESLESPLVEYSRDHPSISISDVRSPSNYTYFPWTLPPELVPCNGWCSKIITRRTFDITFPSTPSMILGSGFLQRVANGILVNSMGGLRLGMIQDIPPDVDSDDVEQYRIQAVNNILLGKDERIFLAKDTASSVVNPHDPNFTRIRDPVSLEIVVDIEPHEGGNLTKSVTPNASNETAAPTTPTPEMMFDSTSQNGEAASSMKQAFSMLLQQVASLVLDQPQADSAATDNLREYIPAILPAGAGAAPLPDVEDALGPDINGAAQDPLLWHSVFVTGEACSRKLPSSIPKQHQVIVMKRGGCSFNQKLSNIPTFVPSKSSLQLVVVVSYDEDDGEQEDDSSTVPTKYLIRPLLESAQSTSSGLPRHNPIPMVMVSGGEEMYKLLKRAVRFGVKRRYSMHAQGVPISNLIIL